MTIELYAVPETDTSGLIESPVSNIKGELPEQEPALNLGDLLGSFDSGEEAIEFVTKQLTDKNQVVIDSQSAPFDAYTHIEWLVVTSKSADQSTHTTKYYLVMDEGY